MKMTTFGARSLTFMFLWSSLLIQGRQLWYGMSYVHQVDLQNERSKDAGILPELLEVSIREPFNPTTTSQNTAGSGMNITSMLLDAWGNLDESQTHVRLPHAFPPSEPIESDAVTVAVHASSQRLNRLLFLIERWGGPVSASIYVNSEHDIVTLLDFNWYHAEALKYTDIHILMEERDKFEYPHNILRNMALQSIQSEYFLALDVDFVTTPNAAHSLHLLIRSDSHLRQELQNRTLMVLPAFNRNLQTKVNEDNVFEIGNEKLPKTKQLAMKDWKVHAMEPFHMRKFHYGHGATDFFKWYKGEGTEESFYKIEYEVGFEPYVLGYKRNVELPQYWEGFRGYGFNKYTWFVEAYYMGFQFGVLKDYFVVHLDHKYGKRKLSRQTKKQLQYFTRHMKENHGLTQKELDDIL
jgi:hypothetical protein